MPVYEYHCLDCDRSFEKREAMDEHDSSRPSCPHCESERVEQVLAPFFAKTSKKS
jgi:putative FmdB family regulatory protein